MMKIMMMRRNTKMKNISANYIFYPMLNLVI